MREKRILVVDDQPHVNRILQRSLIQRGYQVSAASNGEQALELLRTEVFDVVITDYQMPRMDGVALCEAFRAEKPDSDTLMILSTAVADERLCEWAEHMPNILYIEKPVSLRRLNEILRAHFDQENTATVNMG